MSRFAFSFGVILFGLALGYSIQKLNQKYRPDRPLPVERIKSFLQKLALVVFSPIAIAGAVWIVHFNNIRLAVLPLMGVLAFVSGGAIAILFSKMMKLDARKAGAMLGCGSYANIGAVGSLVCFVFLGEPGYALVPLYKLFEEVVYYGIGFPIAKSMSGVTSGQGRKELLLQAVRDPFIVSALIGICVGFTLNVSGIPRPHFYYRINSVIIPLLTICLLVSIGLSLRFSRVQQYMREALAVAATKFILVPALTVGVAYLCGLGDFENGLPLKVVLILSSMPVAFIALIPPSIYDLDLDCANSCWLISTIFLIVELPLLLFLVG
jgi:predicted permease